MKKNAFAGLAIIISMVFAGISCQKETINENFQPANILSGENNNIQGSGLPGNNAAELSDLPLNLTIFNPCCQEMISFTGTIHRVQNSNVIHMADRDISGIGLTSGLFYTVQSTSVRNYVFDPNDYLATLNWSIRMTSENGCGYNVQFIVHVTRDADGEIRASIHSGNFFCQ